MAEELEFGIEQYKAGNKEEARRIFLKIIKEHPHYIRAYQWLYNVARNDNERMNILKRILDINPTHEKAMEMFKELSKKNQSLSIPKLPRPIAKTEEVKKPASNNTNALIAIGTILVFCCICVLIVTYSTWGSDKKAQKDYRTAAFIVCQLYVENGLKAPSTADFASSNNSTISEVSPNIFEVYSYVDAQNSFGAMIRTNYYCKLQYIGTPEADEYSTQNWNLLDVKFDE